jgi:telomerase reverse transcriptase
MPKSKQRRVPVTDSLKRRELLEEFIFWYFDSFVLPLLRVSVACAFNEHD